jgi:hypothetical protein
LNYIGPELKFASTRPIRPVGVEEVMGQESEPDTQHLSDERIAVPFTHSADDGIARHDVDEHEDEKGDQQQNGNELGQTVEAASERVSVECYRSTIRF